MVIKNAPALFCALCVSIYWSIVFIKVIEITPKIGRIPNVIPKEIWGLISRLFMLPLIGIWIYLPWQALTRHPLSSICAWMGAFFALLALGLSCYCWSYMGNAWRIGIDPKEKNQLITEGPFRYIRHPIYAFSMLLVLGTFLSIQTKSMLAILCCHWLLFTFEALREEAYLKKIHGISYEHYMKTSFRFLPYYKMARL